MFFAIFMAAGIGAGAEVRWPDPLAWLANAGRRILDIVLGQLFMVHPTGLRNTQSTDFGTTVDAGSGAGTLELRVGGTPGSGTLLATFTFNDPSFGSPSTGTITAAGFPKTVNAAASGTVGNYIIKDSAGTTCGSGTSVGTSGTEIVLDTTTLVSGQPVTCNSITYAIAAGS